LQALCFWKEANLGIDAAHWHFHPREFIKHFRKCGWLSTDELAQLMPRKHGQNRSSMATVSWAIAKSRFDNARLHFTHIDINKAWRKYGFLTASRQTMFLAQSYI